MTDKISIAPRSLSAAGHPALCSLTDLGYELVAPAPGKTPSEADLLEAVAGRVGWLAGGEPISEAVLAAAPVASHMRRHDRVILSPHNGGFTDEREMRAGEVAVANTPEILRPS